MDQDKIVQDLFRSVELIAEKKVNELEDQKRKYQIELIRLNEKMAYWIRKREVKEKMNPGAMRFVKKGQKNE